MIIGNVNERHEAVISVEILDLNGKYQEIEAVLDTGFSGSLTLPVTTINDLGLSWRSRGSVILANGSEEPCDIYVANIIWDGAMCNILVEAAEIDPLIGMSLLSGYKVHIEVVEGGKVLITKLL